MRNTDQDNRIEAALASSNSWLFAGHLKREAFKNAITLRRGPYALLSDVDILIFWNWFELGFEAGNHRV